MWLLYRIEKEEHTSEMILIKYLRRERAGAGLARAAVGTAVAQKEERPRDATADQHPSKNGWVVVWGQAVVPCCCATVRMKCGGTTRRPPERRRRKVRLVAAYDLEVQLAPVDFLRCQKNPTVRAELRRLVGAEWSRVVA